MQMVMIGLAGGNRFGNLKIRRFEDAGMGLHLQIKPFSNHQIA